MTLPKTEHPLLGILLICIAVFILSVQDAASKYLSGFYPVMMIVWMRYLVHTLLMTVSLAPAKGGLLIKTRAPLLQLVRALCMTGISLFFITGLRYLPLAEATSIMFLAPLLVTLASMLIFREQISGLQWISLFIGLSGILLIARPGGQIFTPAGLFPLGAAVCFAFYQILTRIVNTHDNPVTSNYITGIINLLVLSLLLPLFWKTPENTHHLLLMLLLGACGMAGHQHLTMAFNYGSPALLAPFSYTQIVFATLTGLVIYHHVPDAWALCGMVIVCCSGFMVLLRYLRHKL